MTYAAFFEEVKALGSALVKEGLFGAHTAFWAKNSKELLTSLLTVLATPGTALPLPADATADDAMELLRAGDARLLFLDLSLYRAHKNLLKRLTGLRRLVVFGLPMDEECDFVTGSAISYDRLLALGRALLQTDGTAPETERFLSAPLSEDEPRLLLFPAGDAVAMRGIMFSERNLRLASSASPLCFLRTAAPFRSCPVICRRSWSAACCFRSAAMRRSVSAPPLRT